MQNAVFRLKRHFSGIKSATEFLCVNCQRRCKAFIGLSVHSEMVGGVCPLNVNFSLCAPPLVVAAIRISAFTKSDEYPLFVALIRMQYEIYKNAH